MLYMPGLYLIRYDNPQFFVWNEFMCGKEERSIPECHKGKLRQFQAKNASCKD